MKTPKKIQQFLRQMQIILRMTHGIQLS